MVHPKIHKNGPIIPLITMGAFLRILDEPISQVRSKKKRSLSSLLKISFTHKKIQSVKIKK